MNKKFRIGNKYVGHKCPAYFIADIAANHNGNINKAIDLIYSAADSGANAAKFQHFEAETIVSDFGFKQLGRQKSHQATWKKSVFEVYKKASLPFKWTPILQKHCQKAGIEFLTSPYSLELVEKVNKYVSAFKVGSGDITWFEIIKKMSQKNKPVIIATGASTEKEVNNVINYVSKINKNLCIMQCNTNYTANYENFKFINLNFLEYLKKKYPNLILGLSDHTLGHSTVLGAITLGAKIIEKHFTLSNSLIGPDHKFSMTPKTWKDMVTACRELEWSLGNGIKKVEKNEKETVILQRRSIRAARNIIKGTRLKIKDVSILRPCPKNSIEPNLLKKIISKKINKTIEKGDIIKWQDLV